MADHWVWGMYKFDITSLAGETVVEAYYNWYLNRNDLTSVQMGLSCWRAISLNETDDQDWLTSDGVGKLYDNICEYTRSNGTAEDRHLFDDANVTGYYQWDVATGLQAAITDGDSFFTCVLSRDVGSGGTKTKGSASDANGFISRAGASGNLTRWTTSDGALSQEPFLDILLQSDIDRRVDVI